MRSSALRLSGFNMMASGTPTLPTSCKYAPRRIRSTCSFGNPMKRAILQLKSATRCECSSWTEVWEFGVPPKSCQNLEIAPATACKRCNVAPLVVGIADFLPACAARSKRFLTSQLCEARRSVLPIRPRFRIGMTVIPFARLDFGGRPHLATRPPIGISAKDFRLSDTRLATALLAQADNLLISVVYRGTHLTLGKSSNRSISEQVICNE